MKTITIINAYGEKNIGDAAIQESALQFINKTLKPNDRVFLLSVDSYNYQKHPDFQAKIIQQQLPYGYAIQTSTKPLSRIHKLYRFTKVSIFSLSYTLLANLTKKSLPKSSLYGYIQSIKDADVVLGMGGGYLTSRFSMSDNFGLLLTLLPVYIAKKYRKKIIFFPLTFGPFANTTHATMTHKLLSNTTVFCREKISLEKIKKLNNKKYSVNAIYTPDLALFLDAPKNTRTKSKDNYYVITAREWLDKNHQDVYEKELSIFIQKNWQEKKMKAIFIPMAYNAIEDDDRRVAHRIHKRLNNRNMFTIMYASNPTEVQDILQRAQFSICTRMHSAILSFTTETPFVTIAYSSKTNNFLKDFGLSEWNINIEDFNSKLLNNKIKKLTKKEEYDIFIDLIKTHKRNLTQQKKEFESLLHDFIN
ncbi:MAG TPA: polysaccharide pyruvyl transferase family protein [Candidatus Saccharimonadales bacterium]|nr:polysaccharide pyruvyl transferase family protein [Candidatus Saccharimonadales bacterium]